MVARPRPSPSKLEQSLHRADDARRLNRFLDVRVRPEGHRAISIVRCALRGEYHDWSLFVSGIPEYVPTQ
ncbi:MAG: hypothetical protein WBM48_01480, partial [Polyangiales bacterium]